MKKEHKTNAVRLLEKAGVRYELNVYDVDENDLSAVHVVETLGADIRTLFKTLVLRGDKSGILVCVIPGDAEVDLKKTAKISGNKKVDLIPMKELLPLTGYIRGGCSPIGMKKQYPTYIDSHAQNVPQIFISAGIRGLQIKISPVDLANFLSADIVELI